MPSDNKNEEDGPMLKAEARAVHWKDLGRNAEVMFCSGKSALYNEAYVLKLVDDEEDIIKSLSKKEDAYVAVNVFNGLDASFGGLLKMAFNQRIGDDYIDFDTAENWLSKASDFFIWALKDEGATVGHAQMGNALERLFSGCMPSYVPGDPVNFEGFPE